MSKRTNEDSDNEEGKQMKLSPYFQGNRLKLSDYSKPCPQLATFLLGKTLCRQMSDGVLRGKIVELECYPGATDGASHSYKGETERNRAMFMEPGTSYVYTIYGMYHCFNISSQGQGAAVLLRALELSLIHI